MARTLGDRAKAARRAAKRRVEALEQIARTADVDMRDDIRQQISNFQQLDAMTRMYAGGKRIAGRTAAERLEAVEKLEKAIRVAPIKREIKSYQTLRSNAVFMNDVKVASSSGIDTMSEVEVRVFFRATQKAWEGSAPSERYEAILKAYGVKSLDYLWQKIKKDNQDVIDLLEAIQAGAKPEELTPEQQETLMKLKAADDEQFKRYRKDDEKSPQRGSIASSVKELELP